MDLNSKIAVILDVQKDKVTIIIISRSSLGRLGLLEDHNHNHKNNL